MCGIRALYSRKGLTCPNLQGAFGNLQTIVEGVRLGAVWLGFQSIIYKEQNEFIFILSP
jgi:hypothetical protein